MSTAVAAAPKKKFMVLVGGAYDDNDIMHGPGDVLESRVDLCKRFNSPGSVKFQEVHESTPLSRANAVAPEGVEQQPVDIDALLEKMSDDDLRKFAAENKIRLAGGVNKREAIVAQIKASKLAEQD